MNLYHAAREGGGPEWYIATLEDCYQTIQASALPDDSQALVLRGLREVARYLAGLAQALDEDNTSRG